MPSTLIHLGLAALLAAALLSEHYDWRSLAVVLLVVAIPDIDTFLGLLFEGAHRTVLHNVWVVLIPAALMAWDLHGRERSAIKRRWGARGVRIGWVSLVAVGIAHIALDAFYNGANLFWPVYDGFIDLSGEVVFSPEEGFSQSFVAVDEPAEAVRGTTGDVHYRTGLDPGDHSVREFHLFESGELFVIAVAGYLAAGYRLYEVHRSDR